jgi:hypothetical protein
MLRHARGYALANKGMESLALEFEFVSCRRSVLPFCGHQTLKSRRNTSSGFLS